MENIKNFQEYMNLGIITGSYYEKNLDEISHNTVTHIAELILNLERKYKSTLNEEERENNQKPYNDTTSKLFKILEKSK